MQTDNQLKEIVRQKYSEIALNDKTANQTSCCGAGGCSSEVYNIMTDDYSGLEGFWEAIKAAPGAMLQGIGNSKFGKTGVM